MSCFKNCYSLSKIELSSELTYIDSFCFEYCLSLKEIAINDNVKELGGQLFYNCTSLTSIRLSTSLTKLDKLLFFKCSNIKEIYIGNEKITQYPFDITYSIMLQFKENGIECKEIWLTDFETKNPEYFNSNMIEIPKEVKYLDDNCFRNSKFEIIKLHEGIKSIGEFCFKNCKQLKECKIPKSITNNPSNIFEGCEQLK